MTTKPLIFLFVLGCQGGNLTLPADGSPGRLRPISGFDQQGRVGTELPQPLVVQVIDAAGRPVPEVALRFQTDVPAARFEPAEVATNDSGYAAAHVRLGTREGTQTFEALLADNTGTELRTTFTLLALPHPSDDDDEEEDDEDRGRDQSDGDKKKGEKDRGRGHGGDGEGRGHDDDDDRGRGNDDD